MVTGGKLADSFGRRRMFIIGVSIFILASLFGGFAQNGYEIILSRILQGASSALGVTLTTVIIYTAFPPAQRNMVMGLLTGVVGFSLAIGPTVGGLLTEFLSWRWIFFINVPFGIIAILITLLFTPADSHLPEKTRLDYAGSITLSVGLGALILAISQANQWHILSPLFLSVFSAAIILLVLFYWLEKRQSYPLIATDILINKTFWLGCMIRFLVIAIIYIPLFIISLYMQNILNYSPAKAGVVMLAMTLTIGILSPLGGWLMNHINAKRSVLLAALIIAIVFLLFSRLSSTTTAWHLALLLSIGGIGYSIFSPAILRATMQTIADEKLGVATGVFYMLSVTGGAIDIAVTSAIMTRQTTSHLQYLASQKNIILSNSTAAQVTQSLFNSHSNQGHSIHLLHHLSPIISDLSQQAFVYAFSHVMLFGAFLSALAMLIAFSDLKESEYP